MRPVGLREGVLSSFCFGAFSCVIAAYLCVRFISVARVNAVRIGLPGCVDVLVPGAPSTRLPSVRDSRPGCFLSSQRSSNGYSCASSRGSSGVAATPQTERATRRRCFTLYGDTIEFGHLDKVDELMRPMPYDPNDEELKTKHPQRPSRTLNKKAAELWEKYHHRFPPLPTESDFYERINNTPVTTIKVQGCEIEVRQPGLGLPWFIDEENRIKFISCFEPGSIENASLVADASQYRIPFFEKGNHWLPLPGAAASYLPNVRIVEHRTDIEGYEYVTVLHDSERDYRWTYERSTPNRAQNFDGRGPLELFELTPSGIRPIRAPAPSKYKPFVPVDYFNVPQNVSQYFPRKPLDTGIFRLPKLDDVLNIKMRNTDRDIALATCKSKAPLGYVQLYQNFWKTVSTREHPSGSLVRYRRLGPSDLVVSDICLGTMTFGGTVDELAAHKLLDYAVDDFGINFIDTSELYPLPTSPDTQGKCELLLGRWLAHRGPSTRSKLVVATKIAGRSPHLSWLREGGCTLSKANIIKAVDGCLSRLKIDYLDLLQLHWPDRYVPMHDSGDFDEVLFDPEVAILFPCLFILQRMANSTSVPMEEQLEGIGALLSQGKIRHWGLSNETPWGVLRFHHLAKQAGLPGPASVQLNYNLLCRNDLEKGFVELCRPQNTGTALLAYGPLAGGILTGKYLEYLDATTAARLLRFPSYMARYRGSLAARAVRDYYDIAMSYKYPNLCALALRWVLTRPFICSTIIGVSDLYQLRENLHCLNPSLGVTDRMEREINQLHWKWRDPLRICQ